MRPRIHNHPQEKARDLFYGEAEEVLIHLADQLAEERFVAEGHGAARTGASSRAGSLVKLR